jgi:hypothetical protein
MTPLLSLWLPIIVATAIAFVASSLIHMVLPWHKGDYPLVPNQDQIMDALRPFNLPPGDYMIPRPKDMAEMKTPEFKAKAERGPVLIMTLYKGMMENMGVLMGKWFVYQLVVTLFAAHIAGTLVGPGGDAKLIFHSAFIVAFSGYVLALWQLTIWYRRSMRITLTSTLDGIIYSLIVGLTFVWLWPR